MSRIEEVLKRASREQLVDADAPAPSGPPMFDRAPLDDAEPFWEFPDSAVPVAASIVSDVAEVGAAAGAPDARGLSVAPTGADGEPVDLRSDVLITRTLRLDAIEQYRKLGAALHEAQQERGLRSVLCTSALMGEGKTVTACNLALTLSESYGRRVLLIDADLRRPQIHTMFGIPNAAGLADTLAAPDDTKPVVRQVTSRLSVITAGTKSSDPMTGLISARLRQVIAEATHRFDWVIVDTPPVLILPDARVLVSTVDAVLLVVRAGVTKFRTVLRAVEVIKRERIFGTVLNSVEEQALGADYAGYDRYYAAVRSA